MVDMSLFRLFFRSLPLKPRHFESGFASDKLNNRPFAAVKAEAMPSLKLAV
jgi:hypothetical protein